MPGLLGHRPREEQRHLPPYIGTAVVSSPRENGLYFSCPSLSVEVTHFYRNADFIMSEGGSPVCSGRPSGSSLTVLLSRGGAAVGGADSTLNAPGALSQKKSVFLGGEGKDFYIKIKSVYCREHFRKRRECGVSAELCLCKSHWALPLVPLGRCGES